MLRFLKVLLIAFSLTFAHAAFADDKKGDDKKGDDKKDDKEADPPKGVYLSREEYDKLMSGRRKDDDDDDDDKKKDPPPPEDLRTKVAKEKDDAAKNAAQTKQIERALGFNLAIDDFVVKNAQLLPSEIVQIVKLAHNEKYDSALAKESAVKAAIIQSYFGVQSNTEALTASQKTALDDYLKLTKNGKEQKAAEIYENIFEPALETFRRVKKAEELARGRGQTHSESQLAYKDKLIRTSRAAHLGEKEAK